MGYKVEFDPQADDDLAKLDQITRRRVIEKIEWLATYCDEVTHESVRHLPAYLKGLRKLRSGDWRILYWLHREKRRIVVYAIGHRSWIYKRI